MRLGGTIGFLLQLLAGTIVFAVLCAIAELVAGYFLDPNVAVQRSVDALAQGAPGGDEVAGVLQLLAALPDLPPAPIVPDPLFLWRNTPLAEKTQPINPRPAGTDESWTITIDSHGFRDLDRDLSPPDDVFRIVCLGDSVTFGFNVAQEDAYPRRLERILNERHPGRRIEVLNTAVPGWTWLQGLRFLEVEGPRLHPSLVIAAHGTNDQFPPAKITDAERLPHAEKPFVRALLLTRHRLMQTNTYRLLDQHLAGPIRALTEDSPACREQIQATGTCRRLSLADISTAIDELGRWTTASSVPLLLLNLDFVGTRAVEAARAAATRNGIPLLDFVARFTALRETDEQERATRLALAPAAAAPEKAADARHVVLRVVRPQPAGPMSAKGQDRFRTFEFTAPLYDDGTHGDERARDGVFSTTIDVPSRVHDFGYNFFDAEKAELEALPPFPSTMGARQLHVNGDTIAPVVEYGRLYLMAEQTHPNAEGHVIITREVAETVEGLDAFRRFVRATR